MSADPVAQVRRDTDGAATHPTTTLKREHRPRIPGDLYATASVDLPTTASAESLTDVRIAAAETSNDPGAGRALLPVRPLSADFLRRAPAASPPTCRESGTKASIRPGAASTPSTSTRR